MSGTASGHASGAAVRPRTGAVILAVGRVTFLEILRDKILYNIFLFALLLLGSGFLASRLTFIRPERVIVDFGLAATSISTAMVAVFAGATALTRELERRTIHVALSHPVSRVQFLFGKFAGLAGMLVLNWALLCACYLTILGVTGEEPGASLSGALFAALGLALAQSLVLAAVALLFSSFTTTSLAVILSIGIYLVGNNVSQLRLVAAKVRSPFGAGALNAVSMLLPNLETFNLSTKVTYGLPVSGTFVLTSFLYGACVTGALLLAAGLLLESREL
jgi:ABC-type transport system involved in multi-copper enzyme maturation permease subunit